MKHPGGDLSEGLNFVRKKYIYNRIILRKSGIGMNGFSGG